MRRAARTRRAVRVDQYLRIDFEMPRGIRMDIARRQRPGDAIRRPQQHPAAFQRVRTLCFCKHAGDDIT